MSSEVETLLTSLSAHCNSAQDRAAMAIVGALVNTGEVQMRSLDRFVEGTKSEAPYRVLVVHKISGTELSVTILPVGNGKYFSLCLAPTSDGPTPANLIVPVDDETASTVEERVKRLTPVLRQMIVGSPDARGVHPGESRQPERQQEQQTAQRDSPKFGGLRPQPFEDAFRQPVGRYGESDLAPGGVIPGQQPGFTRAGPSGGMIAGPNSVLFQPSGIPGNALGRYDPIGPFGQDPDPDHEPMIGRPANTFGGRGIGGGAGGPFGGPGTNPNLRSGSGFNYF